MAPSACGNPALCLLAAFTLVIFYLEAGTWFFLEQTLLCYCDLLLKCLSVSLSSGGCKEKEDRHALIGKRKKEKGEVQTFSVCLISI